MIKIKHFLEASETDDGRRMWIGPIGLTRDLQEWCEVTQVLPHLGPPRGLWEWFQEHPEGYDYFRALYHEALAGGQYRAVLDDLSVSSLRENFTLLYQEDDPVHNTATALYEYLTERQAHLQK